MSDNSTGTKDMRPHFEDIQHHYDLSDDFFGVFQDPTRKYSCAYFTGPDATLSEAQIANVDQHLDALDLKPGMTLLEVGCGWGLTLQRAMEKYDVNVIGLTLSKNQKAYCDQLLRKLDSERTFDVRLEGWEQFHSPVDRIVSIEAFEHFGFERYDDFFKTCFDILPDDGRMTIQSSVGFHPYDLAEKGKKLTFDLARFVKFIITEIFPGGRIPTTKMMVEHGEKAGFVVPEPVSLRNHYIKTLGIWASRSSSQGRGDRRHRRGELPPLHAVPDGRPVLLRRRGHRRQPGHLPQARRRSRLTSARRQDSADALARPGGFAVRFSKHIRLGEYQGGGRSVVDAAVISEKMRKNFDNIHAHYDLSDDFFGLFQDPSRIYSCAYFEPDSLSLEEAQYAKVDLHLDRLDLKPGMTCSTSAAAGVPCMKRAVERHDVNVVGLTLSHNQHAASTATARSARHRPQPACAAARLGGVRRARRPHPVHRGVRALRVRAL